MSRKNITKKMLGTFTAAALCMSMAIPAMAAGTSGEVVTVPNGTDVYAGVVVDDETKTDARIRVTVPTLFAFVVNGSADTGNTDPLNFNQGTILLPNVKVNNLQQDGTYEISIEQSSTMTFTNYSTKRGGNSQTGNREGIPVNLKGTIENKGSAAERNNWTHTAKAIAAKEYTLSLGGEKFNTLAGNGTFEMANAIKLEAPAILSTDDLDTTTELAKSGASVDLNFDVEVGGARGDYATVEESAKVGTIVWTVGYEVAAPTPAP